MSNNNKTITCYHGHNVKTCMICEIKRARKINNTKANLFERMSALIITQKLKHQSNG